MLPSERVKLGDMASEGSTTTVQDNQENSMKTYER